MDNSGEFILEKLLELKDEKYGEFVRRLIPNVEGTRIIGIRTPLIRKLATQLAGTNEAEDFLAVLPHYYYEENNLHAFLIEKNRDFQSAAVATDRFLPYIDNWATCDSLSPKIFNKNLGKLLGHIDKWIMSNHTYTRRFAIEMLMNLYLDEAFDPSFPEAVANAENSEYYVNMMVAWYFATALVKQEKSVLPYIEQKRLSSWTHNKTIQKAIESYRISDELKKYLRTMKVK